MLKSVKNKSGLAGTDIVNFMKKKEKFKGALAVAPPAAANDDDNAAPRGRQPLQGSVVSHHNLIKSFLKRQGVQKTNKGLKAGSKTINVSYDDLLYDLTHNPSKTQANLNPRETEASLNFFKSLRMPASFIRNQKLRKRFVEIGFTASSVSDSGGGGSAFKTPIQQQQPSFLDTPLAPHRKTRGFGATRLRDGRRFPDKWNV
jgi:hypothetical protein